MATRSRAGNGSLTAGSATLEGIWHPKVDVVGQIEELRPELQISEVRSQWKILLQRQIPIAETRAAENTIWFASCNACLVPHQNCRSLIVAPDGQVHAQTELRQEQLLVADIDIDQATRAMFNYDLEGCAPLLFGQTVQREEYKQALPSTR